MTAETREKKEAFICFEEKLIDRQRDRKWQSRTRASTSSSLAHTCTTARFLLYTSCCSARHVLPTDHAEHLKQLLALLQRQSLGVQEHSLSANFDGKDSELRERHLCPRCPFCRCVRSAKQIPNAILPHQLDVLGVQVDYP